MLPGYFQEPFAEAEEIKKKTDENKGTGQRQTGKNRLRNGEPGDRNRRSA